jgi:hypothetical protein
MTTLPSIYAICENLSAIPGALVGDPWTTPVDLGETRHVPIHQPCVPVSKKLAADLVNPQRLQGDLLLRPNEDGLFPGFTQTWRALD